MPTPRLPAYQVLALHGGRLPAGSRRWGSQAPVSLQEYIVGSICQSPEASVQGIIAGGYDLEVAILVECGAVREVWG